MHTVGTERKSIAIASRNLLCIHYQMIEEQSSKNVVLTIKVVIGRMIVPAGTIDNFPRMTLARAARLGEHLTESLTENAIDSLCHN